MEALITNIQRFSLTDGPGIRSTVFFQGCNMRCRWCHNPETLSMKPLLMQYRNKCIGCGKCFEVCPEGAHQVVDGQHVIDRDKCKSCGKCASLCFAGALVMSAKKYTVEDVMREVRQDKLYYDLSGGGVTLSGGEVFMQSEFALELVRACHAEGIRVAVETNMNLHFYKMQPLLQELDLIMCDLKIFDVQEHKKWTGVEPLLIENNIGWAGNLGIPIIVRTPLIPGATDSVDNINKIIHHLTKCQNVVRYELLNFNPLGAGKYEALDMPNEFEEYKPFTEKQLEEFRAELKNEGIELVIR